MRKSAALALAFAFGCGAATPPSKAPASAPERVPFAYVGVHFLVVKVKLNDRVETKFVVDTGIGVNLISESVCRALGCVKNGTESGKRMSGQTVTFPMAHVDALALGGKRRTNVPVGVIDFEARNFGIDPSIGGFLSLNFFDDSAFTVDYAGHAFVLETDASLRDRQNAGKTAAIKLEREGASLVAYLPMKLADGEDASIEVDTGSPALTLDSRYLAGLGWTGADAPLRRVENEDETGFHYVRQFANEPVAIGVTAALELGPRPIKTMFQPIIHDGLIGDAFLNQFTVTYDLPHAAMIFGPKAN